MNVLAKIIGIFLFIPIGLVLVALTIITLIGGYIGVILSLMGDLLWVIGGIIAIIFVIKIVKFFLRW